MDNNVVKTKIDTGILSDHNFVAITFLLSTERRGAGLWRFNNSLLNDTEFIESVMLEIENATNALAPYNENVPKGVKVDLLLSNIRAIAIKRSKKLARELRLAENILYL